MFTPHRTVKRFSLAAAAVVATALTLGAAEAPAASRARACFAANGYAISGLPTTLQYYYSGGWRYYGARSATGSNGCITYNVNTAWLRRVPIRVYATGIVPSWNAAVSGYSRYYAPAGNAGYSLGTRALSISALPGAWSPSDWVSEMDNASAGGNCSSSTAMLVACYMDRHGLVGNVIVPYTDTDGDGVFDGYDRYPTNKYYY